VLPVIFAALFAVILPVSAQSLTSKLLDEETDIINTGGALISAANFGEAAVTINGILHGAGSASGANLTIGGTSALFEGDFRNGQSGLGGNLEILLSGIAGRNSMTLAISGLVIGKEYLFQGYWEGWPTEQLDFTAEGTTINVTDQNATLITFRFTATDDTLNISLNKTVAVDGNEWLSGYSLQEVPDSAPDFTTALLDEEADIINTGGAVVSAANFGEAAVTINGILHGAGSASGANLTIGGTSAQFEGDFRNGQSGLGGNLETLLSGIVVRNNMTLAISGLTVGTTYFFQTYWEGWPTEVLNFTAEGYTISVPDQNATLISFTFTATDDTLNISLHKPVAVDGNEWLSGYSLQEVPSDAIFVTSFQQVGVDLYELMLDGSPNTGYVFRSSPTLEFNPGNAVENLLPGVPAVGAIGGTNNSVLTTDSNGFGTARMTLTGPKNFVVATPAP
jgi:hypothetical protein